MIEQLKFDWKFAKKSLKIIVPIMAAQMILVAIGFVDNFMITKYDTAQIHLVAIGVGAEMWFAMQAIYMAIGAVFGVLYPHFFAHKNHKNFRQLFKINLHVSIMFMIIVSLVMYFCATPIVNLFYLSQDHNNGPDLSRAIAADYFQILALGNVFAAITYLLINPLVIMGKQKYLLYIAIISLLINIIFNYIFIYVLDMGTIGAAWSTVLSYGVQFIVSVIIFATNRHIFRKMGSLFIINRRLLKMFLKRSWMIITVTAMHWSLAALTIIWSNMYGPELVKSMSIGYAISGIMFTIFPAISQAIKIIIGQELGQSQFERASILSRHLYFIMLGLMVVVGLIGLTCSLTLPKALINDPRYQTQAAWMIQIYSIALLAHGTNVYFAGIIEAGGHQIQPAIINYFTQIWLVIPLAIIVGPWLIGLNFKWTFLISQFVMFPMALISYYLYRQEKWHINLNHHKHLKHENL